MGVEASTAVWKRSKHKGTKLVLMLAIADHADDQGIAFPSTVTLSKKIRMSHSFTRIKLKELEDSGELKIIIKGGGRLSNRYQITLLEEKDTLPAGRQGGPQAGRPAGRQQGGGEAGTLPAERHAAGRRASPESSSNRQVNRQVNHHPPDGGADAPKTTTEPSLAEIEYLKQFKKAWKTDAQRDKFIEAEALVGPKVMLDVIAWAAVSGVSDVNRIYSACSRWSTEKKGHNTNGNTNHPASPKPAADKSDAERKRDAELAKRKRESAKRKPA